MTTNGIFAGFSKVEITPPLDQMEVFGLGYWYQRSVRFTGIRDPLYVRATAIGDGKDTQLLLSVEAIFDSYGFIDDAVARIRSDLSVPKERVLITCTHTHSAPLIDRNNTACGAEYGAFVAERLAKAAQLAYRDRRLLYPSISRARVAGVLRNRRPLLKSGQVAELHAAIDPRGVVDPGLVNDTLTMLKFRSLEGNLVGGLCHLGIHGVSIQCSDLISSDCMGNAIRMLEHVIGPDAVFLHMNAPCGDIDPVLMGDTAALNDMSARLFKALTSTLSEKELPLALTPQKSTFSAFQARRRETRSSAELRTAIERLSGMQAGEGDTRHHSGPGYELFLLQEEEAVSSMPAQFEIGYQLMRMGDLLWLGIGGEIFTKTGTQLADQGGSTCVLPVGITGKSVGYLPPAAAFMQGGYEVSCARWCTIARGETERLIDCIGAELTSAVDGR